MRPLNRAFLKTLLKTLLVVFFSTGLFGQTFTGHVTDSSGAAVAGATVTIHNQLTGVDITTKTTGAGDYTAPYLKLGLYTLSAEMTGFKTGADGYYP
jgi:hypothetical protein